MKCEDRAGMLDLSQAGSSTDEGSVSLVNEYSERIF